MSPQHLNQKKWVLVLLLLVTLGGYGVANEELLKVKPEFHQFLQEYCISCHGPDKSKGDRVFHTFTKKDGDGWTIDLSDSENKYILQDILDQLNLGEMPPEKKNVKHPLSHELKGTRDWLTETLLNFEKGKKPVQTVLRRLNREEYRRSLEDLLGIKELCYDPCQNFPEDESFHGFKNVGEKLSFTETHLSYYMKTAETYLDLALSFNTRPVSKVVSLDADSWRFKERIDRTVWMYRHRSGKDYVDIGAGRKQLEENLSLATVPSYYKRRNGVQVSGLYNISVDAEAVRRLTHPYDPSMIPTNLNQPMQLGLYIAQGHEGYTAGGTRLRKRVALWDLKDHKKDRYEVKVWLNKGSIPFINWDNGPGPTDWWMRDVLATYHTDIEFKGKEGSHAWHIIGKDLVPGRIVSDVWKGPVMRIHNMKFEGPLPESFQTKAQKSFFDNEVDVNKINLKESIHKFMRKAFRREVSMVEVDPYYELSQVAMNKLGKSRAEAIKTTFKAVLTSPDFLYHNNKVDEKGDLDAYSLASRLSYSLWSSMPDDRLLHLAQSGEILKQSVLKAEVKRMLKSSKSKKFIEEFSKSWLRLDKLGIMQPDKSKYLNYYNEGLEYAMKQETQLYLLDCLKRNLPVTHFIKSNETFVNQALAEHYGMKGIEGSHFRRVKLSHEQHRSGLLGQASVLTLTANGVETSPVTRGIWILEAILGTPPPPPPPDVEALDPDIRGAKTLKQRLAKHRKVESCADCHAKIDPFGFAMEHFDPIGGFRDSYPKVRRWSQHNRQLHYVAGQKIDATSELPSGKNLLGMSDLSESLLKRKGQFMMNLTEKLMIHSTGREMTYKDHLEIEKVAFKRDAESYGFQDLIVEVMGSSIFRKL